MHSVALYFYTDLSLMQLPLAAVGSWITPGRPQQCQVNCLLRPQATATVSHTLLNTHTEPRPGHLPLFHSPSLLLFSYLSTSNSLSSSLLLWGLNSNVSELALLYVMWSLMVSVRASLSFCVISGGTDGGHGAQGVRGYCGDKPARGA